MFQECGNGGRKLRMSSRAHPSQQSFSNSMTTGVRESSGVSSPYRSPRTSLGRAILAMRPTLTATRSIQTLKLSELSCQNDLYTADRLFDRAQLTEKVIATLHQPSAVVDQTKLGDTRYTFVMFLGWTST